ncbi:MAG: recombinase family protein, partial [Pirellulales bacterium]|nr:recombinase family protein [Pirellulales bacterium]
MPQAGLFILDRMTTPPALFSFWSGWKVGGSMSARVDAVFIRKSTEEQKDKDQAANVAAMLCKLNVVVSDEWRFITTVSRRKVTSDPEFKRLIGFVEQRRISTIYVEAHDRLGITKQGEFFTLRDTLIEHGTKLYDLTNQRELTDDNIAADLMSFLGVHQSKEELEKIAQRSLRSRVQGFIANGSWPNGTHPFGFGKRCTDTGGSLLWEWHPISRSLGQQYQVQNGKLKPFGPIGRIPQKQNYHKTILIPTRNKDYVKTVRLVFELFTQVGLSYRQISARLNAEGRRFYDKQFNHTYVAQILTNAAY